MAEISRFCEIILQLFKDHNSLTQKINTVIKRVNTISALMSLWAETLETELKPEICWNNKEILRALDSS